MLEKLAGDQVDWDPTSYSKARLKDVAMHYAWDQGIIQTAFVQSAQETNHSCFISS